MTPAGTGGRLRPPVAIVLAIAAFFLAALWMRGCIGGPLFDRASHPFMLPWLGFYGPLGIWGLLQAALAVWVGLDAGKRGLNGVLWGLLVFFTGIVGLIVYLLVGPAMQTQPTGDAPAATAATAGGRRCGSCATQVAPDFKVCPYCGTSLACGRCGKPVGGDWKVCPYCTGPLDAPGSAP
ncbi:MAG TPA: zinc ribbon domain-containing protein [Candidatus Polarisedimenticolaceae bacterium]|nr:zinc ribbon domain-containing protein [Candidatus Polarisedimenticolaceae bacterium]